MISLPMNVMDSGVLLSLCLSVGPRDAAVGLSLCAVAVQSRDVVWWR